MDKILSYIKKKKIPLSYFIDETGYTKTHISATLNGRRNPSPQFLKLLVIAINKKLECDENDITEIKETLCHLIQ